MKRATTVPEAPLRTTDDTTRDVVNEGGVIEKVNGIAEKWIRSDGVDVVTNPEEVERWLFRPDLAQNMQAVRVLLIATIGFDG